MSKVKLTSISQKERMEIVGDLFDLVYGLKTKKETIDFLVGLLTSSESLMLARRVQIAKKLIEEKTYQEIRDDLKVSYNTINIVEQWLNARKGAYRKILTNWLKENKKQQKQENKNYKRNNYTSLLDRYPQHRFLKDLLGL